MNVAIAGSGAIGAFTGLALRARGIDTTIFESRTRIAGASGRAFGGIRQQFTDPAEIELAQLSLGAFEALPPELFAPVGYLYLATEDSTESSLRHRFELQRRHGVTCEWLDPSRVARAAPGVMCHDVRGALFGPRDGTADPLAITERALTEFEARGGRILTGTPLPHDALSRFDRVVVACGCETSKVLASIHLTHGSLPVLPLRALKRSLAETSEVEADVRLPLVIETHDGFHFRRRGNCVRLALADRPPQWTSAEDLAPTPSADFGAEPMSRLKQRFPSASGASIVRTWSGLYDVTPDAKPIIDRVHDRVFVAAGFSGHGFMISPAVGDRLAAWIAAGTCPPPLQSFGAARFARGDASEFPTPL